MLWMLLSGCAVIPLSEYDAAVEGLAPADFPPLSAEVLDSREELGCPPDFLRIGVNVAFVGETIEVDLVVDGELLGRVELVPVEQDGQGLLTLPIDIRGWPDREAWGVVIEVSHVAVGLERLNLGIDVTNGMPLGYQDSDEDGFGTGSLLRDCDAVPTSGDCDDTVAAVNPGATEIPSNGIDDDCDGMEICYVDHDVDGFGGLVEVLGPIGCDEHGLSAVSTDCDDTVAAVNPGATEIPSNGVDEDCDGLEICYVDQDVDGFGGLLETLGPIGCDEQGFSAVSTDCDDMSDGVFPGASEIPSNGIDEDCDGMEICYVDHDVDGFGGPLEALGPVGCDEHGLSAVSTDCNDTVAAVNPGAIEIPSNGVDDDCDGMEFCYTDLDDDGFAGGSSFVDGPVGCLAPGVFAVADDCNDLNHSVFPGATEFPADGVDQNCDQKELCYADTDGDHVAGNQVILGPLDCMGMGVFPVAEDCDDGDAQVYPGAPERCNGIDDDCDEMLPVEETVDADGDLNLSCDDCNDFDSSVFQGAPELCDGLDNDCDGQVPPDEVDNDGDGFVECTHAILGLNGGDCDDTLALVYPGADEVCDGARNSCDGGIADHGVPPFFSRTPLGATVATTVFSDAFAPVGIAGGVLHLCADALDGEDLVYTVSASLAIAGHGVDRPWVAGTFDVRAPSILEHLALSGGPGVTVVVNEIGYQRGGAVFAHLGAAGLVLRDFVIDCNASTGIQLGGGVFSGRPITLINGEIRNCVAEQGGGMYASTAVNLESVDFFNNEATTGPGGGARLTGGSWIGGTVQGNVSETIGGGLLSFASMDIVGLTFIDNTATTGSGGGVHVRDVTTIQDVEFTGNAATSSGGGAFLFGGSNLTLSSSTFRNNSANLGGGIYIGIGSTTTTTNTTFTSNVSTGPSGAGDLFADFDSTGSIEDSLFSANISVGMGAGVLIRGQDWTLLNTDFVGNQASSATAPGGGLTMSTGQGSIEDCRFTSNSSGRGAGLGVIGGAEVTLARNTWSLNQGTSCGGAVYVDDATATIDNSQLFDNDAAEGAQICVTTSGTMLTNGVTLASSSPVLSTSTVAVDGEFMADFLDVSSSPQDTFTFDVGSHGSLQCNGCTFAPDSNVRGPSGTIAEIVGNPDPLVCNGQDCPL